MSLTKDPAADGLKELNVGRINIVDTDGTVRMVLSNHELFPTQFQFGSETFTHENRGPGVLLYNDEGVECGGLIWGGGLRDGQRTAGASLTFDQYDQDQVVQLFYDETGGQRYYGLSIYDRPATQGLAQMFRESMQLRAMPPGPEKDEARRKLGEGHAQRLFVGREPDGATIRLADAQGRPRLRARVDDDGTAQVEFLNAEGKVVRRLTGDGSEDC
jgi:hypothetical protein